MCTNNRARLLKLAAFDASAAAATGCSQQRPKVLIVDDGRLNRIILSRTLGKLGFAVLEANNGLEGINMYGTHGTDIVAIFLDLNMPVLDGWQTAQRLREMEAISSSTSTMEANSSSTAAEATQEGLRTADSGASASCSCGSCSAAAGAGTATSTGFSPSPARYASPSAQAGVAAEARVGAVRGPARLLEQGTVVARDSLCAQDSMRGYAAARLIQRARSTSSPGLGLGLELGLGSGTGFASFAPFTPQPHRSQGLGTAPSKNQQQQQQPFAWVQQGDACMEADEQLEQRQQYPGCRNQGCSSWRQQRGGPACGGRATSASAPASSPLHDDSDAQRYHRPGPAVRIPVIVCTANDLQAVHGFHDTVTTSALSAGADEVMNKPLSTAVVQLVLDRHLPNWRLLVANAAEAQEARPLPSAAAEAQVVF